MKVDVITDTDGVVFTNKYESFGDITIETLKYLTGRDLKDKEFEFELIENDKVIGKALNVDGKAVFEIIKYTLDDVGEHDYIVREVKGDLENITYDEHEEKVKVNVSDNGDGTLDCKVVTDADGIGFMNTYDEPVVPEKPTESEEPTEPEKPSETPVETKKPEEKSEVTVTKETVKKQISDTKTGDDNMMMMFIVMGVIAVSGVIVSLGYRKYKNR